VPGNIPRLTADGGQAVVPALDWRVAVFTVALSLLTAVLFGLVPALSTSKSGLSVTLKEASGYSATSRGHKRIRAALVVVEMALALVLVAGAVLLIRTFVGLRAVNPGIDSRNVLTFKTSLAGGSYSTTAKVDAFSTQAVRRIETVPGVLSAASAIMLPIEG